MLGVCDFDQQFQFVQAGYEGSGHDSRVLAKGIQKGFTVPTGCYVLGDGVYVNAPWLLTPFRKVRYHLDEWGRTFRNGQYVAAMMMFSKLVSYGDVCGIGVCETMPWLLRLVRWLLYVLFQCLQDYGAGASGNCLYICIG